MKTPSLYPALQEFCQSLETQFEQITDARKEQLLRLSGHISDGYQEGKTPQITVICTHNSRRSHIGQLMLALGADYYRLPTLETFSGGTEATAFNIRAVDAMQKVGFQITTSSEENEQNPVYEIKWSEEMPPYQAFSKQYGDTPNPKSGFVAIMVCSSADDGCPVVFGSSLRLSLPFDDPKDFDRTDLEETKYLERIEEIGREMFFALNQVKKQ